MKHTQKGLTLVGVIIAGVILSTSMITLVDYQNSLTRLRFQQQHVAVGNLLASEGIELARGVRDVNFTPTNRSDPATRWDSGLDNGIYAEDYTMILDIGFDTGTSCGASGVNVSCQLNRDLTNGFYAHSTGVSEELKVYRYIEISETPTPDPTKKKVVSTVILQDRRNIQSEYKAATILYNTDL